MPESWDAGEYRNRATAWLQKAESPPPDVSARPVLPLPTAIRSWPSFSKLNKAVDRRRGDLAYGDTLHLSVGAALNRPTESRNSGPVATSHALITGPMRRRCTSRAEGWRCTG
jgi:hypothetical protein